MPTKTFSSRADESMLAFADALAQKEYGISYGQYCGSILLNAIGRTGRMPKLDQNDGSSKKEEALSFIKGFSPKVKDPSIAALSDAEVKDLIASRYE